MACNLRSPSVTFTSKFVDRNHLQIECFVVAGFLLTSMSRRPSAI